VLVCSQVDAEGLGALMPSTKITVVPNAAPTVRRAPPRERAADATIRLLFVGAMGYFPNQDAARFLCREVVPCLRGMTDRPVRIDIVGPGSVERLADLGHDPTVHLHGRLPDLTACYAEADIAVVPIRAGGGTRIKILEAFAYGAPVVATSLGAEGLEGVDREHLLIADDATDFARACLELVQTPALREALARNGRSLVETRYGRDAVTARIVRMYGECGIAASADAQRCVNLEETDAAE
jgi:glycosyltransferase involved in cell wall biosynthesis